MDSLEREYARCGLEEHQVCFAFTEYDLVDCVNTTHAVIVYFLVYILVEVL